MLKYELFGMSSPNVTKTVIMLEELDANWTFTRVNVLKGEQFEPPFQALNPNGRVPVLLEHRGSSAPFVVIESGAILLYLAERHGRFLPHEADAKSIVIQWLMFQMAGIGPMFGQHVHFSRFAPDGSDYAKARYEAEAKRLLGVVEARLSGRDYLAGQYSIADIATFPWIAQVSPTLVDEAKLPRIAGWLERISNRQAVRKALTRIAEIAAVDSRSMADVTPSDLDRLFNRAPAREGA